MPVFLIEGKMLIALTAKKIKKMRITAAGTHILVFFERMLSCVLIRHVYLLSILDCQRTPLTDCYSTLFLPFIQANCPPPPSPQKTDFPCLLRPIPPKFCLYGRRLFPSPHTDQDRNRWRKHWKDFSLCRIF